MVGLLEGVTEKLRHVLPEGSPNVLWVCELPSLPAKASVKGPRLVGDLTHPCRVAVVPHDTVQLAVHESEAP